MADYIKLINNTTEYTFDHRQVSSAIVNKYQNETLQLKLNNKPISVWTSDEWHTISLTFVTKDNPTIYDTLETLKDIENVMSLEVYYRNGTLAESYKVKIDPDIEFKYENGSRSINPINVRFLEANDLIAAFEFSIFPNNIK